MAKLNYAQVERAIANREKFEGNSCRGYYDNGEYVVLSYSTRIAVVAGAERGGEVWLNPNKYSVTTSRLQNIIRRAWGLV